MKKEIDRYGDSCAFEGIVSLRALLSSMENKVSDRRIKTLLYQRENTEKKPKEYAWLCHQAEKFGFEIRLSSSDEIKENAVGTSHGGIVAFCTERTVPPLRECGDNAPGGRFFALLDGIEDPYNFGYALRSLYAFGVDAVILTERNWMSAAGVVCRSSAGASELLPMYVLSDASELDVFKKCGVRIVCADLRDSVPAWDADLSLPLLLIVGGEKRGISRAVLDKADIRVKIDYARDFGESLSAASASTVLGGEIFRQNRGEF